MLVENGYGLVGYAEPSTEADSEHASPRGGPDHVDANADDGEAMPMDAH